MSTDSKPNWFERFLYMGRWLLAPMYAGLLVVLALYLWRYIVELSHLVTHYGEMGESDLMLGALAAVDQVMVGNLIVFIMIGSYSIFVRSIAKISPDAPGWLQTISSSTLKWKMGASLVGISSIHLLRDFIGAEHHSPELLIKHSSIHLVFIVSTVALAWVDKLTHSPNP